MDSEVSMESQVDEYREDIKQLVHTHMTSINMSEEVRQLMEGMDSGDEVDNDVIFQKLTDRGLIGPVFDSVDKFVKEKQEVIVPPPHSSLIRREVKDKERCLELTLQRGRGFLEHLPSDDLLPGTPAPTFSIHASFQGQRLSSGDLSCLCEVEIQHSFKFSLSASLQVDKKGPDLLAVSEGVYLVLVRRELDGRRVLIGLGKLEWRRVLTERGQRMEGSLDVLGVGNEATVPIGALEYSLNMNLSPGDTAFLRDNPITRQLLDTQLGVEQGRRDEQLRLFLIYSKQWCHEYSQLRPSHRIRKLPLFSSSEGGSPSLACIYVTPLRTHRLIESPRSALRFCSLIPRRSDPLCPGQTSLGELWLSRLAVLSSRGAGEADRAVLLCSLLLGFGLNAFVCAGTNRIGTCYWVATLDTSGPTLFWDTSSGQRYTHQRQTVSDALEGRVHPKEYPYLTLGSVFNHKHFYANLQETDSVPLCSFEVNTPSLWKPLDYEAIRAISLPSWPLATVPLLPPTLTGAEASEAVERELKGQLVQFRMERDLTTHWDDQLEYILAPALVAYEAERELGCVLANEEFQQAVRHHVKPGHTFKGYPVQFNSCEGGKLFRHSLKSELCQEIVSCRGDSLQYSVRARVTCYPDEVFGVWVMWACHYACVL
ncbi:Centrosomal protein of 76 kDa [Oopsacas minuta]|uniref:Centrosomal protein of 76 kDa n=1 Tax=Oopsacas minuta TaxID=111878 RepID=A0AAV7JFJ3_9METZ|nr:Centrosomal protein of 76 kDa [Oopsacas minuta]